MVNSKVAVVFGSTGGMGGQIVAYFRDQRYHLGMFSKSQTDYSDACTLAKSGDAAEYREVENFLVAIETKFKKVDVVIFAIGSVAICMRESYAANVISLHNVLMLTGLIFPEAKVFVIGSQRSQIPNYENMTYCVNKAAVDMLVLTMRQQFPTLKITLIRPGFVDTPLYKENSKVPYTKDGIPFPVTTPGDIAKLILGFLQLSEGAHITEVNIGEPLRERKDLKWRPRV